MRVLSTVSVAVANLAFGWVATVGAADPVAEKTVDFVETYCLSCHDSETKKNGIDLSLFLDEASFAGARKLWVKGLQVVRDHEMPPKKKKQPTQEERDAFVQGLRSLFRRHDAGLPRDPGPSVVRRLNRVEYDNTIRDLCGIEFKPSVVFPPDDRQHGFENIAASLTLSPLLMERYLDAAEQVVKEVLRRGETYKPPVRNGMSQYMNRGTSIPYRIGIYTSDPVSFVFEVAAPGRYEVKVSGRPLLKENPAAKVSVLLSGKEVGKATFPYNDGGRPAVVQIPVDLVAGRHHFTLVYLNPPADQEAKKRAFPVKVNINNKEKHSGYQVYHMNLTGPLDDPPPSYRRIMAAEPDAPPQVRATQILGRFAGRAFRRPVEPDETSTFVAIFDAAKARGKAFDEAVGAALQAILVSPHFLFRLDRSLPTETSNPQPISDYQLATRNVSFELCFRSHPLGLGFKDPLPGSAGILPARNWHGHVSPAGCRRSRVEVHLVQLTVL